MHTVYGILILKQLGSLHFYRTKKLTVIKIKKFNLFPLRACPPIKTQLVVLTAFFISQQPPFHFFHLFQFLFISTFPPPLTFLAILSVCKKTQILHTKISRMAFIKKRLFSVLTIFMSTLDSTVSHEAFSGKNLLILVGKPFYALILVCITEN